MKNSVNLNAAIRAVKAMAKAETMLATAQSVALAAIHKIIVDDKPDHNASLAIKATISRAYAANRPTCSEESSRRIIRDLWNAAVKGITDASKTPRQLAKQAAAKRASIAKSNAKTEAPKGGAIGGQTASPETHSQGHDADDWNKSQHRIECAKGALEQAAALSLLMTKGATVTNEMKQLAASLAARLQIVVDGL